MLSRMSMRVVWLATVAVISNINIVCAAEKGDHFGGIEFFGSSQMTRMELDKILALKPSAPLPSIEHALERLSGQLEKRHIQANLELISVPPDQVYISVDVLDSSVETIATRRLNSPRHVVLSTDKPLELLDQLYMRLSQLATEGRSPAETYKDGMKCYSDEPCAQLAEEIKRFAPKMRQEFLTVVDSDPDPARRVKAIDLLGWSGDVADTASRLIPALDDSDVRVRADVDRYLFPRLNLLGEDFPYDSLVAALSRQICRPSHQDRSKGLATLLALARTRQSTMRDIKRLDESRIKQLSQESLLLTVKEPAQKLIAEIDQWDKGPLSGAQKDPIQP